MFVYFQVSRMVFILILLSISILLVFMLTLQNVEESENDNTFDVDHIIVSSLLPIVPGNIQVSFWNYIAYT